MSTIFYSWQSDLPNKTNRNFIEDAIEKAIRQINRDLTIQESLRDEGIRLDKDTKNLSGSPPIVQSIFEKISKAAVFVPDVSFVGLTKDKRPIPNPNVLVEYGWALAELGHSRIVSVMNTAYGKPSSETLPFDMRHLRWPITFDLSEDASEDERRTEKIQLVRAIAGQLEAIVKADLLKDASANSESAVSPEVRLKSWHEENHVRYIGLYVNHPVRNWPVPANVNHYSLSYFICQSAPIELSHGDFGKALAQVNEKVRERVWTGWSMFHPFTKDEIKPYVVPNVVDEEDIDVIETNLMNYDGIGLPDFWRMTRNGLATLVRVYREDARAIERSENSVLQPGTWLSPRLLIQELSEMTAHASAMAKYFPSATSISFRCSWCGLANRRISEFSAGIDWQLKVSKADLRTTNTTVTPENLELNWAQAVAKLANPVLVLFDGMQISDEWVRTIAPEFRKL